MSIQYLSNSGRVRLAYSAFKGDQGKATVMFLGGYRSDMSGTKATALEALCKARNQSFIRFDYSGHGMSEGQFEKGTIGDWAQDAIDILDHVVKGKVLLVGSSMGGWMAFLVALARKERVHGLIGIAAAPDFTEEIYARLNDTQKEQMESQGYAEVENDYSHEPYYFPKNFYEEAKNHLVLNQKHHLPFPVHLFQGMQDKDVLPETAVKIEAAFTGGPIVATYIEDGDHRLSREKDIALLDQKIQEMSF